MYKVIYNLNILRIIIYVVSINMSAIFKIAFAIGVVCLLGYGGMSAYEWYQTGGMEDITDMFENAKDALGAIGIAGMLAGIAGALSNVVGAGRNDTPEQRKTKKDALSSKNKADADKKKAAADKRKAAAKSRAATRSSKPKTKWFGRK